MMLNNKINLLFYLLFITLSSFQSNAELQDPMANNYGQSLQQQQSHEPSGPEMSQMTSRGGHLPSAGSSPQPTPMEQAASRSSSGFSPQSGM